MGNKFNHSLWFKDEQRKVLILSFSDLLMLREALLNKKVKISEDMGFISEKYPFKDFDLRLFFLSAMNRHLWRHHYFGTQGVIILISNNDLIYGDKLIMELLNVYEDKNLKTVPYLLVFEKGKEEMEILVEKIRSKMNKIENLNFNLQFINNVKEALKINLGLEWLVKVMKAI